MDLQLTGKTALVTGATAGIGLASPARSLKKGCRHPYRTRPGKAAKAAATITDATPDAQVSTVVVDLGTSEGAGPVRRLP